MKAKIVLLSILIVAGILTGCSEMSVVPTTGSADESPTTVDSERYDAAAVSQTTVLVKVRSIETLERLVVEMGSRIVSQWSELGWAQLAVPEGETSESFLTALREQEAVITAEPDGVHTLHEAGEDGSNRATLAATSPAGDYASQWGFAKIGAESAWDVTKGDANIAVAIVSTGFDPSHPEFSDKTVLGAYDATGEGLTDIDDDGLGTQIGGIAGDDGAGGEISGVAWDCPLMPVRVMDSSNTIYTSYLIESLIYLGDYAMAHPEYRIAAAFSSGSREYSSALKDAVDYALDNGVFVAASAGSGGRRQAVYPAAYSGVMGVVASTPDGSPVDHSNSGPWVSVAAPGDRILTTDLNDAYRYSGGSAIAAGYVCGTAALLLSSDPNLSPLQLMNQLEQTAQGSAYSEELGYGVIDAAAALGDLEPMQYGTLDITTNIVPAVGGDIGAGIVTVKDTDGSLVAYGTTGEYGNHLFNAFAPGDYTVDVSYYDRYADSYELDSASVTVSAGQESSHEFTLNVPVEIIRNSVYTEDINEPAGTSHEIPITIVQAGMYEFLTSEYTETCDTELFIYDVNGNLLYQNDNHEEAGDGYSYIGANLEAGDYTVVVEEADLLELNTTFEIFSTEMIY